MNCTSAESRFSALFDGALDAAARSAIERHLASCARCRDGYDRLRAAIPALRSLAPTPGSVDPAFVASVMSRVDRDAAAAASAAAPPRRAARLALTHVLAAAVGAAAVFAFHVYSREITREPAGAKPHASPDSRVRSEPRSDALPTPRIPEIPIVLVGSAAIRRPPSFDASASEFTLRPGDRVEAADTGAIELGVDAGGRLVVRIEQSPPAEPPVPARVNEIRFVELGPLVEVDQELLDNAKQRLDAAFGEGVRRLDADFKDSARVLAGAFASFAARTPAVRPPEATDPGHSERGPEPLAAAPAAGQGGDGIAAPEAPVVIRREGASISLAVKGTLLDTVPELIDLLDSDDREVADLAAARLETLRVRRSARRSRSTASSAASSSIPSRARRRRRAR
jgi:hypothetical protein